MFDWFYEYRHRMCAEDNLWSWFADQFVVECPCCSFYRGLLLGGVAGLAVGLLVALI